MSRRKKCVRCGKARDGKGPMCTACLRQTGLGLRVVSGGAPGLGKRNGPNPPLQTGR
jgi:hypothetical protein